MPSRAPLCTTGAPEVRADGPAPAAGSEGRNEGMPNTYDAIVIGGGHNGLISAGFFAKGGARTVVLEARDRTGGAADTSAPWPEHPDFRVSTYSYVMSLMPPTVIRELELERHGYNVTPFGPYYQAFPDGRSIKIYTDDAAKNYESISQFSKKDAEAMPEWDAWLSGVADVMGPLLLQVPPKVGSMQPRDLVDTLKTAWRARGLGVRGVGDVTRLFTMSVSDLLNDWFESDAVKGMLTVNGVIGTWAGPDSPGTAYVMLHHSIGDVGDGHLGSWGFQQGGMGAVSAACRRSAESFGAEIRTNAKVGKILVQGGRAVGVALENGEELRAPVVVTTIHPKIAFLDLIDRHELLGAARFHRRPRQGAAGPPHGLRRAVLLARVRRARVSGCPHGPRRRRPSVRRRRHPDHPRQGADARRRPLLLDVHPVVSARVGAGAPPGGA